MQSGSYSGTTPDMTSRIKLPFPGKLIKWQGFTVHKTDLEMAPFSESMFNENHNKPIITSPLQLNFIYRYIIEPLTLPPGWFADISDHKKNLLRRNLTRNFKGFGFNVIDSTINGAVLNKAWDVPRVLDIKFTKNPKENLYIFYLVANDVNSSLSILKQHCRGFNDTMCYLSDNAEIKPLLSHNQARDVLMTLWDRYSETENPNLDNAYTILKSVRPAFNSETQHLSCEDKKTFITQLPTQAQGHARDKDLAEILHNNIW